MEAESLQEHFKTLFNRDLDRLIENIEGTPDQLLWATPEGISNSCGVLAQHLVGNLNHYIGKGIGNTDYIRKRKEEFTNTNIPKKALVDQVADLQSTLDTIFDGLTEEDLNAHFKLDFPFSGTNKGALMHLYGHLNYHLGQYNYLRRIQSA